MKDETRTKPQPIARPAEPRPADNFTGREVSCRVLGAFFQELRKKNLPAESLAEGTGYAVDHLLDKHERIDWASYCRLMANVGHMWSDDELVEIGGVWVESPWARPFKVIARLLYTAAEIYRWGAQSGTGPTHLLFTCIQTSFREVGPNHLELEYVMQRGYEPCREFFLVAKGSLIAVPKILDLKAAAVEMVEIEGGVRYDIQIPEGGGTFARLRRIITWPFIARAAARELREAHEALQMRYQDLEAQVAKRKRAEEALRESEQTLQTILNSITDYVWSADIVDRQVIYRYYSPVVERITGYPPEHFMRGVDAWLDIIHPQDRGRAEARLDQEFQGEFVIHEYRIVRSDGQVKWLYGTTSPTLDEAGKVVRLDGVVSDITDRKQLEELLRQSQKMEAIGRLAGGIAHDFNNLLTVITGYSKLLLNSLDDQDPLRKDVAAINRAGERAATLTRQLLAFSRQQTLRPTVLNLNNVVAALVEMLQRLIDEDIDLVTELEPALGLVRADRGQLEQVIVNLVVNARDAMPQGGRLVVETANVELNDADAQRHVDVRPGQYVVLRVKDTGIGMDVETQSHLFEPFFTTKEPGEGTGLGLAAAYGIVEQSGGHIEVDTDPEQGTVFTIYLPQVEGSVEAA